MSASQLSHTQVPALVSDVILPSRLSARRAPVQALKLAALRAAVPHSQLTLSFSGGWTKSSLLEGETPREPRGNLSIMGNHSHLASITTIDSAREEGKGRELLAGGAGTHHMSLGPWLFLHFNTAGAERGAIN